jgi:hypothetical protein
MVKNAEKRLSNLFANLSVEQRLDLILGSYRQNKRLAPGILDGLADHDIERWNTIASSFNAVHVHIRWALTWLAAEVDKLGLRLQLVAARRALLVACPDLASQFSSLDDCDFEQAELADRLDWAWEALRGFEEVVAELNLDCFGRDTLHPESRSTLEICKREVLALAKNLSRMGLGTAKLREPSGDDILLATLRTRAWNSLPLDKTETMAIPRG